jgi:glucose-6-phosphate 1-dehydrogenase
MKKLRVEVDTGQTNGSSKQSGALVLFGATGDLAHKKIFPALYAMAKRGVLTVPVVGVALSPWSLAQLQAHVKDSLQKAGGIDNQAAFDHLISLLRYVRGDYNDQNTFTAIKKALSDTQRPVHYLAIPPFLFATVIRGLGAACRVNSHLLLFELDWNRN